MEKKNRMLFLVAAVVFICSTAFFLKTDPASALRSAWIDEKKLGEICIGQVTRVTDAGLQKAIFLLLFNFSIYRKIKFCFNIIIFFFACKCRGFSIIAHDCFSIFYR